MRRTRRAIAARALGLAAGAVSLLAGDEAIAAGTSYWAVSRADDFEKGTLEGVSVETPGAVVLSPKATPIGEIDGLYGWSLAQDGSGNVYVGTGDGGRVFRASRGGEVVEWFDSIEMEITALAVDRDGTVYAGGSPDGTIFKITGKGEGSTFLDTPEGYVWALAFDGDGVLYAATGSSGRIYKIGRDGKGSVLYEASDLNVLSLVFDAHRGALLAGTQGRGLVLEVSLDGAARVLFDSGHDEIGAIAVAPDGALYVGGSGGESGGKRGKNAPPKSKRDETTSSTKAADGEADDSAGKTGGNASIYRIAPDGVVARVWESEEEFLYALAIGASGNIVAATGGGGAIYEVTPGGSAVLLTRLDEPQVLDLARTPSGLFASTGNLARLYRIGPERTAKGTAQSDVYDARNTARWGSLSWTGETPAGTGIALRVRGGNTEKPDKTWSDWSATLSKAEGSPIPTGRSRFLQWEAELRGDGDATPRLLEVRVSFVQANLPPQVKGVVVFPQGSVLYEGEPDARPKPLFQMLPNGVQVEFSTEGREVAIWGETANPWARAIRTARWDALDPNNDVLTFDIYYRALGEERWKRIKEKHDGSLFSWDTESFADGDYELRVVATDRADNPSGEEQSAEAVSESFSVDNSAPEIVSLSATRESDGRIAVRAAARDARSFLKRALSVVDAEEWVAVGAADGIFDSRSEEFSFRTEKVEPGEHAVVLKVFDEQGNARVGRVIVR
jgi:WD40 repeat protein